MTTRNLENITIHQFRGLKELELKDLGQINLLVGVNNSGKTSVLEALSIYCDPLDLRGWISTALQRENSFTTAQTSIFDLLQWLFTKEKTRTGTILISGDGRFAVKRLKAVYQEVESILLLKNTKTRIAKIEQQNYSIPESENTPEVVRRLNLKIELHASETNFLGTETYPFIRQYQLQENEPFLFQGDIDSRYTLLIS
ncbi:MAG: AAA family ATPase, partial [Pseudanabaena sp.]